MCESLRRRWEATGALAEREAVDPLVARLCTTVLTW